MAPPTKFTPATLKRGEDYIARAEAKPLAVPTLQGYCRAMGISVALLDQWEKDPRKRDIILEAKSRVMALQHDRLIEGGLNGTMNQQIARLMLGANHGYFERASVDHTSSDKSMSPAPVVVTLGGRTLESDGTLVSVRHDEPRED